MKPALGSWRRDFMLVSAVLGAFSIYWNEPVVGILFFILAAILWNGDR